MKNIFKRGFAFFLTVLVVVYVMPVDYFSINVFAECNKICGQCGNDVYYNLDSGVLQIYGDGDMYDYSAANVSETKSNSPFSNDNTILQVVVEEGVTSIGDYSFIYCEKINNISLPNSVTKVGYNSFCGCKSLTSIVLPENLTAIGGGAFSYCTELSELYIPKSVNNIGYSIVYNCKSLKKFTIDKDNANYCAQDGCLYDKNKLNLLNCTYSAGKKCVIPDSVECIAYGAFSGCNQLTEVIIPDSVTTIENYAFNSCQNLNAIVIPEGVISLGACTFQNCTSLAQITIPYTVGYIHKDAFNLCNNVTIYGYTGSVAEEFAIQNSFQFVSISDKTFDIDTDIFNSMKSTKLNIEVLEMGKDDIALLRLDSVNYKFYGGRKEVQVQSQNEDVVVIETVNLINDSSGLYYEIKLKAVNEGSTKISIHTANDLKYCIINVSNSYSDSSSENVTVSWYNGEKLINKSFVASGSIPQYNGETPVDPYGLKRTFLGWTKVDNKTFIIDTPEALDSVYQDTSYYAVYSNEIEDSGLEMVDYVNQHYISARSKAWTNLNETIEIKNQLENSAVKAGQVGYAYLQYAEKLATFNFIGVIDQYSANEYTAILLDMFMSVEGIEKAQTILDSSAYKSEGEVINALKKILKANKIGGFTSDQEYYNIAKELYEAVGISLSDIELNSDNWVKQPNQIVDQNINNICEKYNILASDLDTEVNINIFNTTVADALSSVGIGISTVKDFIDNINAIVAAQTLYNMGQTYRDLLIRIYDESKNYSGNSWEITDLQNALMYQIEYHDKYCLNMVKESFKTAYEATDGLTQLSGTSLGEIITGTTSPKIMSKYLSKFITDTFGTQIIEKMAQVAEKNGIDLSKTSVSVTETVVSKYISAFSLGVTLGNICSEALFDLENKNDLYYKGKCYAVLEEILLNVIDEKAQSLIKSIESESDIHKQYEAAVEFDKAYKMYMYVEANGLKTYSEYEASLATSEINDEDSLITKINKSLNNAGSYITTKITSLTKGEQEAFELYMRHVKNAAELKTESDFILNKYRCHDGYDLGTPKTYDIFKLYRGIKIALISCPVQVNVYDENHTLIGTLSENVSNVLDEYSNYLYRIESIDTNVVIVPENYTIEIIGLDDGTMDIMTSYFYDDLVNGMLYNNVPVDKNLSAELVINAENFSIVNNVITIGEENFLY